MTAVVSIEALVRRDRLIVVVSAAVLFVLAWLTLMGHQDGHIASPHVQPPSFSAFALTVGMWMVMMVAMMLPPVTPWIVFHTRLARERGGPVSPYPSTVAFAAGYFAVWGAFSLVAAVAQLSLRSAALLAPRELVIAPLAGGVLLVVAGLFQLSPLKSSCLTHCRNPLSFFVAEWRDGPTGSFGMGLRHGAYCVACCWALMVLSFALGVMNLLWMALLTAFLCLEKIAPGGARISRLSGFVLIAWGAWLCVVAS